MEILRSYVDWTEILCCSVFGTLITALGKNTENNHTGNAFSGAKKINRVNELAIHKAFFDLNIRSKNTI